jgi:hypothetical protein
MGIFSGYYYGISMEIKYSHKIVNFPKILGKYSKNGSF